MGQMRRHADRTAFVFAGQGSQYGGMGKSLYESSAAARAVFDLAESLRPGTLKQCFEGSAEELKMTGNTQPCLYCVDLAAAEALRDAGVEPAAAAGFSLGEIAALTFTGALSPETGFRIVCRRGELMQEAAGQADTAMAAVLKLDFQQVEILCARYEDLYPVNYNCPGQLVVAGEKAALEQLKADVKDCGGRVVPLQVGGGFHSPYMAQAAAHFADALQACDVGSPKMPLYANLTALPYEGDTREMMAKQMQNPVRWQATIENMLAAGMDTFVEVGPGKTLCGLIRKTAPDAVCYQVEDAESLADTVRELRKI